VSFFIAEVSSNHSRDLARSLKFIDTAAAIGCDAVKFQLFRIDELYAQEIVQRMEKIRARKQWELPVEFLPDLSARCTDRNIRFICTPFYLGAVKVLEPYVASYKIASYELLWDDLLARCACTGKPVILSTGMATLAEVHHAVGVLRKNGAYDITLLHCTSAYPTPYNEANLAAIETLRQATHCKIGWSDHTVEPCVIFRAVFHWNADVVEFHLDLEGKGEEFEAGHCWLPEQIAPVIEQIRKGTRADGSGVKAPVPSELPDRMWRADPSDGLRPLKQIRTDVG
jgi:N-acetylneuraminate synthase